MNNITACIQAALATTPRTSQAYTLLNENTYDKRCRPYYKTYFPIHFFPLRIVS